MIGSVRHPPRASPSISAKSFVVDAPSRNRPKIPPMNHGSTPAPVLTARPRRPEEEKAKAPADEPRLDSGDGLDRGPARNLEQHAARDRDRHVGPDAEPLGAERRGGIKDGNQRPQHH